MRLVTVLVFVALWLFLPAALAGQIEALTVQTTPETVVVSSGETVPVRVEFGNIITPREPIVFTATIEWQDAYGEPYTRSASMTVIVTQPITVLTYSVVIPPYFEFVPDSAKLAGQSSEPLYVPDPLAPLWFELGLTIFENESVVLEYQLRAQ